MAAGPFFELTGFRHCPRCGGEALADFAGKAMRCEGCGYLYFHNTAVSVSAIIEWDGQILLVRRAEAPGKGLYKFPGGFVDNGESLEQATAREVAEELGLATTAARYLGSSHNRYRYAEVDYYSCDTFFACRIETITPIRAEDDIDGYRLLAPEVITPELFAFANNGRFLFECYLPRRSAILATLAG